MTTQTIERAAAPRGLGMPRGRQLAIAGAIAAAVAAAWPWTAGQFVLHLAILACINIVIVNGLSLIDRCGQLSFGHSAPVALGAYGSVLFSTLFGLGTIAAAALSLVAGALLAGALGWVILRLRGVYFVLVTFAFAELVRLVLLDAASVTGGANGIAGIPPLSIGGFAFDSRERFYALALALAVASVGFMVWFFARPLGRAMTAVAANPALAESTGLNVQRLQVVAYIGGSMLAALGGVLTARYVGFISPESFGTSASVAFITMLVIGGRKSLFGPMLGALVLTPLPELFRGAVQTQHIFYGAALILILRFLPGGIAGLLSLRAARGAGR
ncbi:branched-chain amino acid ABC transporter permease [Variovorax saccharolyticus]|uniref:branched-chain amino acid ABC transporter permease n=1 Tax=Variovorax saccharolyticus TaxID=3053516 RepID=UPI002575B2CC|nr:MULTISPECIES: branched-chain amino acid ABC transporter permease [unclassified Variovorax]MDM0018836.1 branched-chain amino acid ABC transporter permease [Variovorax sp. J22R187]MDM0026659.1 branched-chain amino acid ABC transporter permease [Variovorax sp. J31P216]